MISNFENDYLSPLKSDHLPHKIGHGQHRWTVGGIQRRVQSVESGLDVSLTYGQRYSNYSPRWKSSKEMSELEHRTNSYGKFVIPTRFHRFSGNIQVFEWIV